VPQQGDAPVKTISPAAATKNGPAPVEVLAAERPAALAGLIAQAPAALLTRCPE